MNTRSGTRGGLKLETHKRRSTTRPLRSASIPDLLILPLDQHTGRPARPIVAPGDVVVRGQPIAQPDGQISAWLHSPVAGRIRAIEQRPSPHHPQTPVASIVLENDGTDRSYEHPQFDAASADPRTLREYIALGGIVGLGGAIFPTAAKLLRAPEASAHLIVNGAECEPWISCDDTLMRERASDVIEGASMLRRALRAEHCTIAVEDDMNAAAHALRTAAAQFGDGAPAIVEVPSIYPAGGERQLITALTGLEVPSGGLPQDVGIVCQNVGTAAAVAHWIRDRTPLIRRIVTVTGSAIKEPANLEALIGTPMSVLVDDCGGFATEPTALIMGGTMMGIAMPDPALVVAKGTNCVLAVTSLDIDRPGEEMPCIRCGACSEVCPASLLPQQLHRFALAHEIQNLDRYGLLDCIECGCCDYVCPSQIPLVERFRVAKPALITHLESRRMAVDAKAHYEARETRLARLDDEHRAKLAEKRAAFKKE